jgi:hypothetical protein
MGQDHKRGIAVEPLGPTFLGNKSSADETSEAPGEKLEKFRVVRVQFTIQLHMVSFSSAGAARIFPPDVFTEHGHRCGSRTGGRGL